MWIAAWCISLSTCIKTYNEKKAHIAIALDKQITHSNQCTYIVIGYNVCSKIKSNVEYVCISGIFYRLGLCHGISHLTKRFEKVVER